MSIRLLILGLSGMFTGGVMGFQIHEMYFCTPCDEYEQPDNTHIQRELDSLLHLLDSLDEKYARDSVEFMDRIKKRDARIARIERSIKRTDMSRATDAELDSIFESLP